MVNAQEWLDKEYPLAERSEIVELDISDKNLTETLDLTTFPNLESLNCNDNYLDNLIIKENSQLKLIHCKDNIFHTLTITNQPLLTELDCSDNNYLTNLTVTNNASLTEFNCPFCKLTNLELTNNPRLRKLWCSHNNLTNLNFLTQLNPANLNYLAISNNNLTNLELTIFSKLVNLENLNCGNDSEKRIKSGNYNRFTGSLEPLKNLTKLRELCIEGTDIDSGLEYLPNSLNEAKYDTDTETPNSNGSRVYCSPKRRPGSKVGKIKEQLKPFNYNLGKWKRANKEALEEKAKKQDKQINCLTQELTEIKSKLTEHEINLTNTRSLLDKANSELTKTQEELTQIKTELKNAQTTLFFADHDYQKERKVKEEQISTKQAELTAKMEEIADLKTQFGVKDEIIKNKEAEITTNYQALVISNRELDKLKADYQTQQTKISELESQLTGLALGSSLLVKQVEDLTNQKTQAEQATERIKLAKEINDNLLKSKENELKNKNNTISQQATQIITYQNIIRNSEANLAKAQAINLAKIESLEKLEQERNNLQEELENAEEKIKQLETSLLTSQTKIAELETKIKGLELNLTDDNKLEITNLRKQLAQEKLKSKQQIIQLQTELTKLKAKEAQLSAQIKNLTTKQEQVKVEVKSPSTWSKIKTPLLIFGGIGIIFIGYKLFRSKLTNNS